MKKTRFLWIRELPTKCREHDLRGVLQKFGDVQKVRMLKDGSARYAIVAFGDTKGATQAVNSDVKIHDVPVKLEYCDSFDTSGINFIKKSDIFPQLNIGSLDKEQLPQEVSTKNSHDHIALGSNDHIVSNTFSKRPNSRLVTNVTETPSNQVLRSVQNAICHPRSISVRGLKLCNLPPTNKLKDAQLRQTLFTELRHCGRIQSVVLPSIPEETNESGRIAIVTFRRPEEAQCAFHALQNGDKLLFSSSVIAELHPGFESPDDYPVRCSTPVAQVPNESSSNTKMIPNSLLPAHLNSPASKCPTRTLYVSGLTAGSNGPVTSEQLNTAFRKFGDIMDVKLQTVSNSALIQFTEMRGPIRAMSAHIRDPLRLGGRPLFLAYVPSPPSTGLWFSDLPPVLAKMNDEEMLRSLSNLAPVQEIILINRTDSNSRLNQSSHPQTPSTSVGTQGHVQHYVAYIRMLSVEHASRLLTELRSGKHFVERPTPNALTVPSSRVPSRRPFAVDFANARQTSLVASLQIGAARSTTGCAQIRVISATSLDLAKRLGTNMVPNLRSPTSCASLQLSHSSVISSSARSSLKSSSPTLNRSTTQRASMDSRYHHSLNINGSMAVTVASTTPSTTIASAADPGGDNQGSNPSADVSLSRLDTRSITRSCESSHRSPHTASWTSTITSSTKNGRAKLFQNTQSMDRMELAQDSSPSSLSTSSSSLSSETSESSSSSSSTSDSSSSSSSSSVSSPSSLSDSSARSRTRRRLTDHSTPPKSTNRFSFLDNRLLSHRARGAFANQLPSTILKKPQHGNHNSLKRTNSESISSQLGKMQSDSTSNSLLNENSAITASVRRPLSVMTTIASGVLSPARSSTASSGGLSSPGIANGTSSSVPSSRVSNLLSSENAETISNSANQLSSTVTQSHHGIPSGSSHGIPLTLNAAEARGSPAVNQNLLSASSGVSSCGRSFSSTSSNSSGSGSPFIHSNVVTMHQTSSSSKLVTSVAPHHAHLHANKLPSASTSLCTNLSKSTDINSRQKSSHADSNDRKARVYSSENPSGLKLHISASGNPTNPQASVAALSSPPSASPLTVSIRLSGSENESHNTVATITSPSALSAHGDVFGGKRSSKAGNASHPSTPVSAPPHLTNLDSNRRFSSQSIDMSCNKTPLSDSSRSHGTDWFTLGSPVYESMYDKIKRRTNKEAEERRQRQQEALDAREKKRRRQRKKDQLARSPTNSVPFTPPESFGSEHSTKTAGTNSSGKSRSSKSNRTKSDAALRQSSKRSGSFLKRKINEKDFLTNGDGIDYSGSWHSPKSSPMNRTWLSHTGEARTTELTSKSTNKRAHKVKRSRRDQSSVSSSFSSGDERNSCSPPGTLTRLSLGMRFPVSATYHECVRPKETSQSNWTSDHDDDSLSRLSSSLSCSSSEGRSDHPRTNHSKPSNSPGVFNQSHCRDYDTHVTKHAPNGPRGVKRDSTGNMYSLIGCSVTKPNYRKSQDPLPLRHQLTTSKKQPFHSLVDRSRSTAAESKNKNIAGSKRKHEDCALKQSAKRHRVSHKLMSRNPHERDRSRKSLQTGHTPKPPYFSDDATLLDSETDDIKCSDSVSHTTGTSDHNIRSQRPSVYRSRRFSSGLHSGTDESSVSDTFSPSPVRGNDNRSPSKYAARYRKHHSVAMSICSDPHNRLIDDHDSIYDTFLDSDRLSTNTKSTPSTEPMEQTEVIERNMEMKFSDDEWHSSVPSTSPNPNNLDFEVDFCRSDVKTEHSSTTYQSTSFSSQLVSPMGKMRTPFEDDSDDELLHKVAVNSTKSSGSNSEDSHKLTTPEKTGRSLGPAQETMKLTSPVLSDVKPEITISKCSDVNVDVSGKLVESDASSISPSHPNQISPGASLDHKSVDYAFKADESMLNGDLHTATFSATKSDVANTSNESSFTSVEPQDISCSAPLHLQHGISTSPRSTPEPVSVDDSGPANRVTLIQSVHVSDSVPLSSPCVSAPVESYVNRPVINAVKSEADVPLKTNASPTRLCSQVVDKSAGESIINTSVTVTSPATRVSHIDTKLSRPLPDAIDVAKTMVFTTAAQPPTTLPNVGRSHASAGEQTKTSSCTPQQSIGPPIEAHEITRYVQSVIERVKAERVEESQQAAAAAAAAHHTNGSQPTAISCSMGSQFSSSLPTRTNHESVSSVVTGFISSSSTSKRTVTTHRRPLLLTTSTCTSVKTGTVCSSTKCSASSSASYSQSTSLTFCGPTTVPTALCQHPAVSIATTTNVHPLISTSPLNSSTDLHLPSIPGVNACAPLAISPQQHVSAVTGRLTRQSQQQSSTNLHASNKRTEGALSLGDNQPPSVRPGTGSGRRRRRSESKILTPTTCKENTSATVVLPEVVPSVGLCPPNVVHVDPVIKPKSVNEDILNDSVADSIRPGGQIVQNTNVSNTVQKLQLSVDPYEPNFDDESPVGFDHGQLHHHRSTPPVCSSPAPFQTNSVRKHTSVAASVTAPCASPSSIHSGLSPVSNAGCDTAGGNHPVSNNSDSGPTTSTTASSSAAIKVLPSDSVDEVIRDVCAGQFDVRSYMNNWWTDHPSTGGRQTKCSPRITQQTALGTINSTTTAMSTVVNSIVTGYPAISVTTTSVHDIPQSTSAAVRIVPSNAPSSATSSSTSLPMSTSNPIAKLTTAPISTVAKSFPLAISEPVVAAVTIPVSSNGAKTLAPGKDGSNSVVNIATGNALLNTLLAALQRIPGSQVTVGGVGSGAISATTITLPVNAARQAAANITAAVLSATGGGVATTSSETSVQEGIASQNTNKEKISVAEYSSKLTTSTPGASSRCSVEPDPQHHPNSVLPAVLHNQSSPRSLSDQVSNASQVGSSISSIPHLTNKIQSTRSSTVSSQVSMHGKRMVVSTPSDPGFIDATILSTKPGINALSQHQPLLPHQPTKTVSMECTTTGLIPQPRPLPSVTSPSTVLQLPISTPTVVIPSPVSQISQPSVLPSTPGPMISSVAPHPNVSGLLKPSFSALMPTQPQPANIRSSIRLPPSMSPVVSGRTPVLSAVSSTSDAIQALLERFGGAIEPSVLMAIAQAAATGVGPMENSVGNVDGESPPALVYLRRWAQQVLESRTCNGSSTGMKLANVPVSMDGSTKSVSPQVTTPPVSAVPVLSFANQPRSAQFSALSINTVNSVNSIPVSASTVPTRTGTAIQVAQDTNAALISPPVGVTRHSPTSNPTMAIGSSGHISWSAVGQAYPLVWQGRLSLKNAETRVALHYIHGNPTLLNDCMRLLASGGGGQPQHSLVSNGGPLRIVQRMRLEPAQLEGVQRKIHQEGASCACLALPAGNSTAELFQQTQILNESFIRYMQEKMAAGIINVGFPEYQQGLYVVHIFPPCEFSHAQLNLAAPELYRRVLQANQSHLLVVITTV